MHKFIFLIPLINFDSQSTQIKLSENLIIRPVTEGDEVLLRETSRLWRYPTINCKYILDIVILKEEAESEPGMHFQEIQEILDNIIMMLNLFKEGFVGYSYIIQKLSTENNLSTTSTLTLRYFFSKKRAALNQSYYLGNDETKDFIQFYRKYHKYNNKFRLALEYFNKSYIEPFTPRDSLIDLTIALENMYVGKSRSEISYKLRIRMAFTLSKHTDKFNDRTEIFQDIKDAYNIRSSIVHGGNNQDDLSYDFLVKIREYTRESLKIFLETPQLHDQLDNMVLKA